jgi:hypothetical protein
MPTRPTYVWDYDLDEAQFADLLSGRTTVGRLDQEWATVHLLEYAPYREIIRLLGYRGVVCVTFLDGRRHTTILLFQKAF